MDERTFKPANWQLPLYGAFAAILVLFPKIVFGNDVGTIFITMLLGAIVCVALLIVAVLKIRRHTIASLLMVVVFCAVCWALVRISDDVRTVCRWALHENAYKAEVLAQPSSTDGRLKHVEWDGWGFCRKWRYGGLSCFRPQRFTCVGGKDWLSREIQRHSLRSFACAPS
jgi:hypothetical protein